MKKNKTEYIVVNAFSEISESERKEKINNAIKYAKELKDRYTVLWVYNLVRR